MHQRHPLKGLEIVRVAGGEASVRAERSQHPTRCSHNTCSCRADLAPDCARCSSGRQDGKLRPGFATNESNGQGEDAKGDQKTGRGRCGTEG